MKITKPPHNRYVLNCLDHETYVKYANVYSGCKRWGIRGIYNFLAETGLWEITKEIAQGSIVQYEKRRLTTVLIGFYTYICAPAVSLLTDATRIVKSCKGYVMEAFEDASHIPFLPLDLALFGQPVTANKEGRFSSWSDITNIIDNLPTIGDS